MSIRPLAAILILLCVACGGAEKPAQTVSAAALPDDDTPREGGTLNRRIDLDIVTLNPVISTSRYDRYVAYYLFTPLLHIDRDLKPIPGLAESWEVSEDGLLYTFKLNPKATFSDGTPVRATDVLFTLRKIVDPAVEAVQIAGSFEHLDLARTRVLDAHTIEVAFKQVYAGQLIRFNDVLTLPEHIYSKGDFRKDFTSRAVGSGPYKLVRRVPAKEVVVERRADYWDKKPYIQTVVLKVVNDHGTAFNALRLGQLDETMIASDTWVRERTNPELTDRIDFQRFYTLNYNYIGWNTRNPLLTDKRVRRALTMCVPIESIINDLYHGTARAMAGPFTPDEWAYNPNVPAVRYNPLEAKKLLAEAGWRDSDGDGVVDKEGRKFTLTLLTMTGSATARQIAQMMQSELKKAGIALELQMMDGAMAIQRILAGNFEACYLSWDLDPDPDPFIIFHSSQSPPRGQNFVSYSNPEADRLMEAARRELDQSKRRDLYWRLHEVLVEDQPYTWVVQVSAKWGVNKRLRNVHASRGTGFFNWYPGELDWWIAAER